MSGPLPTDLARLLAAPDAASKEAEWERLIAGESQGLLRLVRSLGGGHDAAMDRYSFILERLREDDFRRLRGYVNDGRARFSTWLAVVARRLCVDHHRAQFGRARPAKTAGSGERSGSLRLRWDLGHLAAVGDLLAQIPDTSTPPADELLQTTELQQALTSAVAALDVADQLLLKHWFEDDLSAREIASLLGFASSFHVYRRVRATCALLRQALRARGIDGLRS